MKLDKNDYANILKLLERATFNGLEEAKYAAVLSVKLQNAMAEFDAPPALPKD